MILFYDLLLTILTPFIEFVGKIGFPKRKITGEHYYNWRNKIDIGTVFLTKTNYELSNLINPSEIKHAAIFVGDVFGIGIPCIAEATGDGVKINNLVSFLMDKDIVVGVKPSFIRNENEFKFQVMKSALTYEGIKYDYLFKKGAKSFYCFELVAKILSDAYPELNLKCIEIVKGKKIYDSSTFFDEDFFEILFDSREEK